MLKTVKIIAMYTRTTFASFIIITLFILIAGFIFYHHTDTIPTASTLVLTPVPGVSPTKTPEPVVTSWTTYTNEKYNFTIESPQGWNQQEFTLPSGGLLVAFSPGTLPCKTCTYVNNGYYSVKIYNQQTDDQSYTHFTTRMKSIGKSRDYIPIELDSVKGVLFGNTVAVENHGWVYEVSLDIDNGYDKVTDSQTFERAASSLKFTYLIFNN